MPDNAPASGFIDTNIWLYAFISADDAAKTTRANELIRSSRPLVSVQVINEVCVNLLRRAAFAESAIPSLIESFFATCEVVHPSQGTLVTASTLRQRYSLSFWDSLIITAAIEAGASILHTEDMQHGLLVDGKLTIVNPFA